MTTTDELRKQIESDGVEFIYAMFVEMHGKPNAKLVPVTCLDDLMTEGAGFAGFAAGPIGQKPSDPDILAIPDPDSYTVLPWLPNVAAMQCDPTVEGEPWPYAPRLILKNALAKARETHGVVLKSGVEAEYMLVDKDEAGTLRVADERDVDMLPCYDARALSRNLDHLTTVSKNLDAMGWGNYANDHEDANGQFEQNWQFSDALTTADRLIVFRLMIHSLAQQEGIWATFMPKPFSDKTGNGLHTHLSLWSADKDEPLFHDDDDPRGLGLSEMAYQFTAGLVSHAQGLTAITCPIPNSYKRMGVGAPTSGATWAPAYAVYGTNNRTQMIRVPDAGRIEVRVVDGAANPYLTFAAQLACGLDGISSGLDAGEPNSDNLYEASLEELAAKGIESLPLTLWHACDALVEDDVLRAGLGTTPGGDYVDYFAEIKRAEFKADHDEVSNSEIARYLTLF